MRGRRWATLWLVAVMAMAAGLPVRAQYDDGLPPGVLQVTVDDQPIDASTTPQIANRNPVFAGRLSGDPESVELGIGNGDVTRFTLEVDPDNGRFRGTGPRRLDPGRYSLYINDALVGEFVITGAEGSLEADAGRAEVGEMLDLARLAPLPSDLADALPDLGIVVEGGADDPNPTRYRSAADQAREAAAEGATREEIAQATRELIDAGIRWQYNNLLAVPNPEEPTRFDVQLNSFVVEYADADTAELYYDAFVERQGGEVVEGAATIGDASQFNRSSGVASETGVAYRALQLAFRLDRLVFVVLYADLLNREPDQAAVEGLGQAMAERAGAVLGDEVVGLSPLALRLDLDRANGEQSVVETYEVVDGQVLAFYDEEEADRAAREANYVGTTDVYGASFVVADEAAGRRAGRNATPTPTDGGGGISYAVTLHQFPGEAEADDWLAGLGDRLSQDPLRGYLSFSAVDDAPTFGDASATYTFRRGGGEAAAASGYRVYVRVGDIVAAIELSATPEASLEAVQELVEAQVACLVAGTCPEPAQIPRALGGGNPERDGAAENAGGENEGRERSSDGGGERAGRNRDEAEATETP